VLRGKQTWIFKNKPYIISSATVGGPFEAKSAVAEYFDILHGRLRAGEDSFEKAERKMQKQACEVAISKAGLGKEDIQLMLSGDLINQIISSSFAARDLGIPFLGLYGACSTSAQGLAMASSLVNAGYAKRVVAATSSHNAASEKQYRYPTEYGSQKPPTAQWTVTGAGAAVVSSEGSGPRVVCATIGRVIDMGVSDPFNMGSAMAPAAADTIETHFNDTRLSPSDYDLIVTGDLGKVGHRIATELLLDKGFKMPEGRFNDCGVMIYREEQDVFAGGSGCACSAIVTYGYLLDMMRKGAIKRLLLVSTGALLSPMSYQQRESIPAVAHAVSIEM
jgi:stage V sporulation protein AD